MDPKTAIEMKFYFDALYGACIAEFFCRGVVVRSSKRNAPTSAIAIVSAIAHSQLLRHAGRNEDSPQHGLIGRYPGKV
jgi:hypothetical protein